LSESKEAVVDIRFSPRHQGLKVAACSAHGEIRIYEASDLVNLTVWNTVYAFQTSIHGTNCCAWNPAEPPMLIVGNNWDDSRTVPSEPLQLWSLNRATKRWEKTHVVEDQESSVTDIDWAPQVCRRSHLIATSFKDGSVIVWRYENGRMKEESPLEAGGSAVRVTWNILGTCLAIANDRGEVSLWKRNLYKRWEKMRDFAPRVSSG
jgi:nucleoporin SEH1